MGKYDPLRDYLRRQRADTVTMSFAEIERRLGAMLPNRAAVPGWWSDQSGAGQSLQQQAWRDAGFSAACIAGQEMVVFRRLAGESVSSEPVCELAEVRSEPFRRDLG